MRKKKNKSVGLPGLVALAIVLLLAINTESTILLKRAPDLNCINTDITLFEGAVEKHVDLIYINPCAALNSLDAHSDPLKITTRSYRRIQEQCDSV